MQLAALLVADSLIDSRGLNVVVVRGQHGPLRRNDQELFAAPVEVGVTLVPGHRLVDGAAVGNDGVDPDIGGAAGIPAQERRAGLQQGEHQRYRPAGGRGGALVPYDRQAETVGYVGERNIELPSCAEEPIPLLPAVTVAEAESRPSELKLLCV